MKGQIGFIIDPTSSLNPVKDSTLLLMQAAIRMGFGVWWSNSNTIFATNSGVSAKWNAYGKNVSPSPKFLNDLDIICLLYTSPSPRDRQ